MVNSANIGVESINSADKLAFILYMFFFYLCVYLHLLPNNISRTTFYYVC